MDTAHSYKSIYEYIKKNSLIHKKKTFFLSLNKSENLNYQNLIDFIDKFEIYLLKKKIKPQKNIIVIFDNSKLLTLLFLSIISNNRVFVPINPNAGRDEINYIIKQTNPSMVLIDNNLRFKFTYIKNKKLLKPEIFINKIFKINNKNFLTKRKNTKLNKAQILFTSGSTGKAKGVVLTHQSMIENIFGIKNNLQLAKSENMRFLSTTPLYHNNGQFIPTLLPIIYGGSTSTISPETSIITFWPTCIQLKIHYSSVMATHINYFNATNFYKKHFIKALFCGGAKLDEQAHKLFEKKFHTKVLCNYGLTETSSIACTEGLNNKLRKIGSVGKPLFNNKIKIKKIKMKNYGEILIKGKNLFLEYINQKKLTNKIKINSWLKTGDLGYFDKKGFLYIKDRLDNMIIVSGENIYPSEIENHLSGLKEIKIGIVSSVTDNISQNKLIFIYEAKKKLKYEHFYNFFKSKISKFKIPKQIYHVNELGLKEIPKAPNKKILRSKLKKYLEETLVTKKL